MRWTTWRAIFGRPYMKGSAEPFVSEEELKLVLSGALKSGQAGANTRPLFSST